MKEYEKEILKVEELKKIGKKPGKLNFIIL
jgi:hypothetical protein